MTLPWELLQLHSSRKTIFLSRPETLGLTILWNDMLSNFFAYMYMFIVHMYSFVKYTTLLLLVINDAKNEDLLQYDVPSHIHRVVN